MAGFLKNRSQQKNNKQIGKVTAMKSWYQDRYQTAVAIKNMMFFIMLFAFGLAGASVWTVSVLSESKVFEPYLIQVEERTGIITKVSDQSVERLTSEEWVKRYFLVQYLKAREGYDPHNYQYNYSQVVRLMSTTGVYNQFWATVDPQKNKDSPINLGLDFSMEVLVKSFTPLEPEKWQIRFAVKQYRLDNRSVMSTKDYIATINFKFEELDLSQEDRYVNPLGFRVIGYIRDDEKVYNIPANS